MVTLPPRTHKIGRWARFRASLHAVMKGKYSVPLGNQTPVVQAVVNSHYVLHKTRLATTRVARPRSL